MSDSPEHATDYEGLVNLLTNFHSVERAERDLAITKLKAIDRESSIRLLTEMLHGTDSELKCDAAEALLRIDPDQTMEFVLPLLADADSNVRWNTCGLLHDFGDRRATSGLVTVLEGDPETDVRYIAACALGRVGDRSVIPVLRKAQVHDDGEDREGRRVRIAAGEAIEEIMSRC